ncbi:MAG: hypothetical protein L0Z07_03745 [Planctomycetes bacterium]|nr:hypothetical protein [Planctomycetota bacterium]
MDWLGRWDLAVVAVAAIIAVMSLVRLMRQRRDQLVADVQRQMDARRNRKTDHHEPKAKSQN